MAKKNKQVKLQPSQAAPKAAAVQMQPPLSKTSFSFKGILALVISIACLFIVYKVNDGFFNDRIGGYYEDFLSQKGDLSIEKRKMERWGGSYYYSNLIVDAFRKVARDTTATILVPSTAYFKAGGVDYYVPEPSVFYYYTAKKTVWQNCKMEPMPKWYCYMVNGGLFVDSIRSKQQLDSIIKLWEPYPASL